MKLFLSFVAAAFTTLLPVDLHAASIWLSDLPKAQAQAQAEGKHVLINFTGSDWCGWCIKLRKDVFLKPEFDAYARSNLVLVEVDFPKRKPQPPALQQTNRKLAEYFRVEGYPTLVLLDSRGTNIGKVSYGNGGAKTFLAQVEKVIRPPLELAPQYSPARKVVEPRRAAQGSKAVPSRPPDITLKKITGTRQKKATINDRTLAEGQTATFRSAAGQVKIRCVEIREKSVIVAINDQQERRELRLADGAR